ncbi:threonine synthase [Paenibacillus sp. sptzw28]|uniref:threonine synthase n=1 Tax=Paenibacillus sp. sptzw28 TaxID=715179 RepID=UPI001C6E2D49|nr:threonine synthase [Paenibacillus sp. sptzw28]QYR19663.1 threonine synthase [Paenibacillus sp. sptzw28]
MRAACSECGIQTSLSPMQYSCSCGGLLQVIHAASEPDTDKLKRIFHERRSERNTLYASGVWRYKELIAPDLPDHMIVCKNEGNTGMYQSESLTEYAGVRGLSLKAQSENPSGSFKDNGMTAAVSHGRWLGYDRFACSSTGNTSSSLAMYAALAGVKSIVLVPDRDVSAGKVLQTLAYGADLCTFRGTYDDGIRFLQENAEELGLYVCNSINPLRIEGQKSIIYEIAQELDWKLPDWIVLPGGALSNAAALGRGLQDLFSLGFIERLPQVAVVQAEGASPFHRMVASMRCSGNNGLPPCIEFHSEQQPQTRASALNIGNPPSWRKALRTLTLTQGTTVSVSDQEIMEAKAYIDRSGIGCEPASAAALAGLRKLVRQGDVHPEQTAVCILTGNMLKDTDAISEYHLRNDPSSALRNTMRQVDLIYEAFQ